MRLAPGEEVSGSLTAEDTSTGQQVRVDMYTTVTDEDERNGLRVRGFLTVSEERTLGEVIERHLPRSAGWSGRFANVVDHYASAVGRIIVASKDTGDEKFATGFLFDTRCLLLTAAHVVDPERLELQYVEFGDRRVGAVVKTVDHKSDIATLELDAPVEASPLRIRLPPTSVAWGSECVVIGFPNIPGMEPTPPSVYELQLASVKRNYIVGERLLDLSTHLGSGFSGSPVIDGRHALLGIVIAFPEEHVPANDESAAPVWPRWTPWAIGSDAITRHIQPS